MPSSTELKRGFAVAFAVCAAFALGTSLGNHGVQLPTSWMPIGVAAALHVRWGRSVWPWAVLGGLLFGTLMYRPPHGAVAGALIMVTGPWLLAWMLERTGFRQDFSRCSDVLRFVVATPLAMAIPSTLALGAMAAFAPANAALRAPLDHWVEWWQNATIAVMTIAPAFISLTRDSIREWVERRYMALALLLVTVVYCAAMFYLPPGLRAGWLAPVGVVIVVVSAMRMGLAFTGLLTLVMTMSMAMAMALVAGNAGATVSATGTARIWAYCMVLAGVTLVLRALLAEREALDRRLREAEIEYRQGLLEAAAREQARIGRDVHDALGQELTAISLLARSLAARSRDHAPELREDADEIVRTCGRAVQSARAIARGLVPSIEHGEDLLQALGALGQRISTAASGLEVRVVATQGLDIPAEPARNLYRIAQEAMSNVLKHSNARTVTLRLEPVTMGDARPGVRLSVEDDGIGIESAQAAGAPSVQGLGHRTMQYRAEVSGGRIRFDSAPGAGTRVVCEIPLPVGTGAATATGAGVTGAGAGADLEPATDTRAA